jgi:peroxiredoxin/gas vesicle protein
MKRTLILIGMLPALVALSTPAGAEERAGAGNKAGATSPAPRQKPAARERDQEQQRRVQSLREQIDALTASHQSLMNELQAIRVRAVREKATETVKQIDTVTSRRQERHEKQLQPLRQELQGLQIALKERGAAPATPQPGKRERDASRGRKAPDFELDSFDGRTFKLSDYQGSFVVLEWLNTDCPQVKYHYEQAKTMVNLAQKYREQNVVWLAINSTSQTTTEANREFTRKYGLPYPILDDRSGVVGRLYGAGRTPHLFVIDREGYIAYSGAIDNASPDKPQRGGAKTNYVDKALSELLAKKKVSVPATPPYGTAVGYPPAR